MILVNSEANQRVAFWMVKEQDATAGALVDAVTGIVPTVQWSKNGGAWAAATNTAVEVGNGLYYIALTSSEVDTDGPLAMRANGTGAAEWRDDHQVITGLPIVGDAEVTTIDSALLNKIADYVIRRSFTNLSNSLDGDPKELRSLFGVIGAIVGPWSQSGDEVEFYEADGTTVYGTLTLSSGTGLTNPVVGQG